VKPVNWETTPSPNHEIRDMRKIIKDSEIHLSWFWSNEIDFVYIYKGHTDHLKPLSELNESDLTFYTREEYKANQGYKGRVDGVGRYFYRILPCQKRDGKLIVFNQENDKNVIYLTGTKAKIYFTINTQNRFLKPKKIVKMSITTEIPLDKELLVYVKKRGGVPVSIEDGTKFPFIRDFVSGKNEQPEIEIDKDEHVRIFFSNGKQSAEIYELIPE
jgi:hypothetical protein